MEIEKYYIHFNYKQGKLLITIWLCKILHYTFNII